MPFASAWRHGSGGGAWPPAWETFRQRLLRERAALGLHDGPREFARILHLCLTPSVAEVAEVGAALELAAASGRSSADAVRQLVRWADEPMPSGAPLDPGRYPAYHLPQPRPALAAYNRLLVGQSANPPIRQSANPPIRQSAKAPTNVPSERGPGTRAGKE